MINNIFLQIIFVLLLALIITFLYSGSASDSSTRSITDIISTILFSVTIVFSVLLLGFAFTRGQLHLKSIVSLFVFMIVLIFSYFMIPSNFMNHYAYLILPITLVIGILLFGINYYQINTDILNKMKNVTSNITMNDFASLLNHYSILYASLIFFVLILAVINPGNYITSYLNYFIAFAVVLLFYGLMYFLSMVFSLNRSGNRENPTSTLGLVLGFLKVIVFLALIVTIIVGMVYYPGGLFKEKSIKIAVIETLTYISVIVGIITTISSFFKESGTGTGTPVDLYNTITKLNSAYKYIMILLFIGVFLCLVYNVLQYIVQHSTMGSYILIFVAVAIVLMAALSFFLGRQGFNRRNISWTSWTAFFLSGFRNVMSTPSNYFALFILVILFYVFYFFLMPILQKKFVKQGGTLLIENPIYLDQETTLGTYYTLNPSFAPTDSTRGGYNYNYAISCWVFLDAFSPSTNTSYTQDTSILTFGNNPTISYNASKNTLKITMKKNSVFPTRDSNTTTTTRDDSVIIYENNNYLLQKWNNVIINYNGGTLDIIINGVLVKSQPDVVSYMSSDTLMVGKDTGLKGGICNVIYFPTQLNSEQIYNLYHYAKDTNPPVLFNSNKTILSQIS